MKRPGRVTIALGVGTVLAGAVLAGAALAGVIFVGCGTSEGCTREIATREAREIAHTRRQTYQDLLDAPGAPRGSALLAAAAPGGVSTSPTFFNVYVAEVTPNGAVVIEASLDHVTQRGGGGTYTAVQVQLCLRYTLKPGETVTVDDAPCPSDLARLVGRTRPADAVITLTD